MISVFTNPEKYQQARSAYYVTLKGPGWLVSEKQKIATEEVGPIMNKYSDEYESLKNKHKSQESIMNIVNVLKSQEDEENSDNLYLKSQLQKEKNKASVINRLNSLSSGQIIQASTPYVSILVDIIIAILGLIVLFLTYGKIKTYFFSPPPTFTQEIGLTS